MRITIIPQDKSVSIDGEFLDGVDLNWIPEFIGDQSGISIPVHALQWYGDHGEIELESRDSNIAITELGIFEQVITKFEERRLAIQEEAATQNNNSLLDIDAILAELESEENANVGVATT
jgi:hypothetical protein